MNQKQLEAEREHLRGKYQALLRRADSVQEVEAIYRRYDRELALLESQVQHGVIQRLRAWLRPTRAASD